MDASQDHEPDPDPDEADDGEPGPPERAPEGTGPLMIGPVLGVVIGYVVFKLLPDDTPTVLGFGIAVVVIAAVIYATIEYGRWRARRP